MNLCARYQHDRPSGRFTVDEREILEAGSVEAALEVAKQAAIDQGLHDASIYLEDEEGTRQKIAHIFEEHGKKLLSDL